MAEVGYQEALQRIENYKKNPPENRSLDLSFLKLKSIPKEVMEIEDLTELDLSSNLLTKIKQLEALTSLTKLNLAYNKLSNIKPLTALTSLTSLELQNNQLSDIMPLEKLTNLIKLYLYKNKLLDIKPLKELASLTELSLSANLLSDIKPLKELRGLSALFLYNNQLRNINPLEGLINLDFINLSGNHISDIRPLRELTNLVTLHLDNNEISDLSPLEGLTNLETVNLSKNNLINFYTSPKAVLESRLNWLEQIPKLKLHIGNNPFINENEKIKKELYDSAYDANHYDVFVGDLRQAISDKNNIDYDNNSFILPKKMLLLGNSDAGKSTFCDFLLDNKKFADEKRESTEVLSILKWEYNKRKKDYAFIYDFGGQDFYHGTYQMFLSHESLYTVLWDKNTNFNHAVDKETEQRKYPYINYDLRYWLNNIEYLTRELPDIKELKTDSEKKDEEKSEVVKNKNESSPNYSHEPVILIENKIDKTFKGKSQMKLPALNCKEQFRISLIKKPKGVIAINDRRKLLVNYVKEELAQMHSEEVFSTVNRNIIEAFLNKREELIEENDIIQLKDFANAILGDKHPKWWNDIKKQGAKRQEVELKHALRLLHNRGLLLYFHDVPQLEKCIFIDPEQVLNRIKDGIIKKAQSKNNDKPNGKLSKNDLKGFNKQFLALALNQQIIFDNSSSKVDEEHYIIPAFLESSDKSNLLYEFSISGMKPMFSLKFNHFMPYGLMNRVICGFGKEPHRKYFFKNEIIFTLNEDDNIWIKYDPVKLQIDIWSTLNNSEARSNLKYKKFVYRILMAAYYRIPTLDWKTYSSKDVIESVKPGLPFDDINKRLIEHYGREFDQKEYTRQYDSWGKLQDFERAFYLNKEIYAPKDLLLSVDGEYFVELSELKKAFDEKNSKTILTAETINTDEPIEIKEIKRHHFNAFMPNDFPPPKKVFISYAHEDAHFRKDLQKYLINLEREDLIEIWQDGLIEPGEDWDNKILSKLYEADWIIMLISQNFIASNYIYEKELRIALERVSKDGARITPILLSNCDWKNWKALPKNISDTVLEKEVDYKSISDFSFLPLDKNEEIKPVKKWDDQEDAWTKIIEAFRKLLMPEEEN